MENFVKYTTVCVDIYGRVYDLAKEHPSWEQSQKNKGKKDNGFEKCIVKTAFTCTQSECDKLKLKGSKKK